jgi:hypothetical protein
VAGVAERGDGTGRELIFRTSREPPDEREIGLGMDTYCLVTKNQGTAYGSMRELIIDGDRMRVVPRRDALDDLGWRTVAPSCADCGRRTS